MRQQVIGSVFPLCLHFKVIADSIRMRQYPHANCSQVIAAVQADARHGVQQHWNHWLQQPRRWRCMTGTCTGTGTGFLEDCSRVPDHAHKFTISMDRVSPQLYYSMIITEIKMGNISVPWTLDWPICSSPQWYSKRSSGQQQCTINPGL